MLKKIIFFGLLSFVLNVCNGQPKKKQGAIGVKNKIKVASKNKHSVFNYDATKNCKCIAQYELKDSLKLFHIKDQFYKNESGHLYELTSAFVESGNPNNKPTFKDYFNGHFAQEVDPLTFEQLDGWYAKDKNYVYYYRPVSGGMWISKIDKADNKTFKLLKGHYKYAMDKNNFYDESETIVGFSPIKTKLIMDKKGSVVKMNCKNKNYKFKVVN